MTKFHFPSHCSHSEKTCVLLHLGALICALEFLNIYSEKDWSELLISPNRLLEFLLRLQPSDKEAGQLALKPRVEPQHLADGGPRNPMANPGCMPNCRIFQLSV